MELVPVYCCRLEFGDPLVILFERRLLQWNTHVFHYQVIQLLVGRMTPTKQLPVGLKSGYFFFDLFLIYHSILDDLNHRLLAVNLRLQFEYITILILLERLIFDDVAGTQGLDNLVGSSLALDMRVPCRGTACGSRPCSTLTCSPRTTTPWGALPLPGVRPNGM